MNCPACGNAVAPGENFCRVCGRGQAPTSIAPGVATAGFSGPTIVPQTSGKAIASLICGLFFFFFPVSIVAIIFGHLSLSEIRKSGGRLKGEGYSIAGLVLGYAGIVTIPFILIVAAIAIPNLLRARMAANESSAVSSLRTLITAEVTYSSGHPDKGYTCSLPDLAEANLLGRLQLTNGTRSGYQFELLGCTPDEHGTVSSYRVVAYPITRNQTGVRAFCSDESAVIRVDSAGSPADCVTSGTPLYR